MSQITTKFIADSAIDNDKLDSTAITGQTATVSPDDADVILIYDDSVGALRKITRANFLSASGSDILETSFAASNDVSSPTDVTSFAFANGSVRSFSAHVSVFRDATSDVFEVIELKGVQRGSDWAMSDSRTGDTSGIEFTITTAGQIQYTSSDLSGHVASTIKFRAITTTV